VKIRVSDSGTAHSLVSAINATDCAAALTGTDTVDVFLPWLESDSGAAESQAGAELLFFLRAWALRRDGFEVEPA
jgi:hypothetical protein